MIFDKSRVFTALNADEVKTGSKGYFADSISGLRRIVEDDAVIGVLKRVLEANNPSRFVKDRAAYNLFYLVEEPQEEKYHPYENTDEMIEDFKERIKAYGAVPFRCPMFMQNIWIKSKTNPDNKSLITRFGDDNVGLNDYVFWDLKSLFKEFTYLDGTPCGKKIEE